MKNRWEYIGGNQWSLINYTDEYEKSISSVEIEKGKYPRVVFLNAILTKDELQELLNISYKETEL